LITARGLGMPANRKFYRTLALGLLAATLSLGHPGIVAARAAPESFADLAQDVSPAVVNITTSTVIAQPTERGPMLPEGSPFNDFFRDFFGDRGQGGPGGPGERGPQRGQALGSGFVISEDGYIVTNNHVIDGADDIEIEFFSGERLKAKLVGTDPNTDIAVLKVESTEKLPYVKFGDSDDMRVGDWVLAVGNPLGQGFSVSSGIVSARGRTLQGSYDDYLQTDAAINRGNSGGPLFNMDGEVVGVNTAILSPTGGSIGIGFAMASNVTENVVDQLMEYGETRRGWLGVRIGEVTADIAEALGMDKPEGVLIADVPEGPAKEAGLRAGDVIVAFDDGKVADTRALMRRVADAEIGKKVQVTVLRDGKEQPFEVTLGRRETQGDEGGATGDKPEQAQTQEQVLGMSLRAPSASERDALGMASGAAGLLITEVAPDSDAGRKGLAAGDVLVEASQKPIASVADLEARIAEAKEAGRKSVLMLVRRGGEPRFVALSVE